MASNAAAPAPATIQGCHQSPQPILASAVKGCSGISQPSLALGKLRLAKGCCRRTLGRWAAGCSVTMHTVCQDPATFLDLGQGPSAPCNAHEGRERPCVWAYYRHEQSEASQLLDEWKSRGIPMGLSTLQQLPGTPFRFDSQECPHHASYRCPRTCGTAWPARTRTRA